MAICVGHLVYESVWETEKTGILLQLWGDDYDIFLAIQYTATELSELQEGEKEKETLESL